MTMMQAFKEDRLNSLQEQQNIRDAEFLSRHATAQELLAPATNGLGLSSEASPEIPTLQTSGQVSFVAGPSPRPVKVPKPDPFSGKRKKLHTFLAQLDIYAELTNQFPTERAQVLHATMLLQGTATAWIQPYLRAARDRKEVPLSTSYPLFVAELTRAFGVIDEVAAAKR